MKKLGYLLFVLLKLSTIISIAAFTVTMADIIAMQMASDNILRLEYSALITSMCSALITIIAFYIIMRIKLPKIETAEEGIHG